MHYPATTLVKNEVKLTYWAVTETRTGTDYTDSIYAILLLTLVCVFSKNLPFHAAGDLVSLPDAQIIMGSVPCPKPKKLGHRISNAKYKSLIVNCICSHVGFVLTVVDQMSRILGLGKGTVPVLIPFNLV